MDTKASNLNFWNDDPLLYFLKGKLRLSNIGVVILLIGLAAFVEFGLAWLADSFYTGNGLRFSEPEAYSFSWIYVFLFVPVVFGFYVWQPEAIANVLVSFEKTNVILGVSENGKKHIKSYAEFLKKFESSVDRKEWLIIIVIGIILFYLIEFYLTWPAEFMTTGRTAFWYDIKWFLVARLLNWALFLHALWMLIIKEVLAIIYFNRLFRWCEVKIRPMHPDEAGGLGALGNFTLKTSLIAIGFGVIALVFSIFTLYIGSDLLSRPDVLVLWVLYILVTPTSLILPMLSAHYAMTNARNDKLGEISKEFEKTLISSDVAAADDVEGIRKGNERLTELQNRYNIIAASFPTWPVPARLFRNFSISASLPLMSGVMSMVINFATK